jgi:hypothetical protein
MFAHVYSLCSAAVAHDARLPPAERERVSDNYGGRAVELLRKAHTAGYFRGSDRLGRIKENKDLDGIRSRDEFAGLLAEIENQANAKP